MWQAADSLLVLRDQVDLIAPGRSRASDGLLCDENHSPDSDHCPHEVPGIGRDVVTAIDLTHDPAGGFDSYLFAEILRIHRDKRIKYVISNGRMFSSYATSSTPAWVWRKYTGGPDPHTNHVHVSVLDDAISDSRIPWNLDGFEEEDMTPAQQYVQHVINYRVDGIVHMRPTINVPAFTATDGSKFPAITENNDLAAAIRAIQDTVDEIPGGGTTFPAQSTFGTSPLTGTIIWNQTP